MRTKVLNHFHTFYHDAEDELSRLMREEKRLTLAKARQGDEDSPRRQRMSQPAEDVDAALDDVRAKMQQQRDIIASGVVRVIVKGLTRGEFRRLLMEHPPRDDVEYDKRVGYNSDTFGDALIQACILETRALAPDGTSGEPVPNEWDKWADEMTNGQWEEFFTACLRLTNDPAPSFPL